MITGLALHFGYSDLLQIGQILKCHYTEASVIMKIISIGLVPYHSIFLSRQRPPLIFQLTKSPAKSQKVSFMLLREGITSMS